MAGARGETWSGASETFYPNQPRRDFLLMNSLRFERFSQPQYLQRVGRERVTQMLMPHATELLAHGISLPDDVLFLVLATLPGRQAALSAGLREVMTAIEVIEEVLPDERTARPWVVSGLQLRLSARHRPILLTPEPRAGGMLVAEALEPCFSVAVTAEPGLGANGEVRMKNVEAAALCEPAAHPACGGPHPTLRATLSRSTGEGNLPSAEKGKARYKFSRKGSVYVVRYDGMAKFHLADKLGARYLGYWLHHANAPISAFDLERIIRPEKALVRAKDSIQGHLDAEAVRAYLRQLDALREQREEAAEDGNLARADQLDEAIAAIAAALKQPGQAADAGERARVNVNKAVTAVLRHLRKGGVAEQAFGRHLEQFLSLGYECCYHQPPGTVWQ